MSTKRLLLKVSVGGGGKRRISIYGRLPDGVSPDRLEAIAQGLLQISKEAVGAGDGDVFEVPAAAVSDLEMIFGKMFGESK